MAGPYNSSWDAIRATTGTPSATVLALTASGSVTYSFVGTDVVGVGGIFNGWKVANSSRMIALVEGSGYVQANVTMGPRAIWTEDSLAPAEAPHLYLDVQGDFDIAVKTAIINAGDYTKSMGVGACQADTVTQNNSGVCAMTLGNWTATTGKIKGRCSRFNAAASNGELTAQDWVTPIWVRTIRSQGLVSLAWKRNDGDVWTYRATSQPWDVAGETTRLMIGFGGDLNKANVFRVYRVDATYFPAAA